MFQMFPLFTQLVIGLFIIFLLKRAWRSSKVGSLPGPKPYPLIGNIYDFPAMADMVSRVQLWKQKYGPIVHLSAFGRHLIILNDWATVREFFDRRGALYAHRPYFTMVGELCGFDRLPAIAPDGNSLRLRELRKVLNSEIGFKSCKRYEELMEREVPTYLNKLCNEPDAFVSHNRWLTVDIVMLVSYGYRVAIQNDYHMLQAEHIMQKLSRDAQPGTWAVDIFPILRFIPRWFPGSHFKQYAEETRRELDDWVIRPWELVKTQKLNTQSFSQTLLDKCPGLTKDEEDIIMWSAASIYSAGSDTTVSAITTFFLAMAMFPKIQEEAQRELDSVLGEDIEIRLPQFSDQERLKYTNAIVLEVLRWGSILPLGAPRRAGILDFYEGHEIPRDATVLANIWGICHDSDLYYDPMRFDPTRFLDPHPQPDPRELVFGFGRRVCPGRFLAERTLFIAIASILSVFNISAVDGQPPKYKFDDGFISHPTPFKCHIKLRCPRAETLISKTCTEFST